MRDLGLFILSKIRDFYYNIDGYCFAHCLGTVILSMFTLVCACGFVCYSSVSPVPLSLI